MNSIKYVFLLFVVSFIWDSCTKLDENASLDKELQGKDFQEQEIVFVKSELSHDNPVFFEGYITHTKIQVQVAPNLNRDMHDCESSLDIDTEGEDCKLLFRGDEWCVDATGTLCLPPVADIMFNFDYSGSMSSEINQVKIHAGAIFSTLSAEIGDLQVGVSSGIESWNPHSNLSPNVSDFQNGLNAVPNTPTSSSENYALHLSELTNTPMWRDGAAHVVVMFLDEEPQEYGGYDFEDAKADLIAAGIIPVIVYSGPDCETCDGLNPWNLPGFNTFRINGDGTIPEGVNIEQFIIEAIGASFCVAEDVALDVASEYEDWITIHPESYDEFNTCENDEIPFEICVNIPADAEHGEHHIDFDLVANGQVYASASLCVDVIKEVSLDIHPTSCPNPLNTKSKGVIPVAILGSEELDVNTIDVSSILLNGIAPIRHAYDDVATYYEPLRGKEGIYDCTTDKADGFLDLTLKFKNQPVIGTLPGASKGDSFVLSIWGKTHDGVTIYGEDIVKIAN